MQRVKGIDPTGTDDGFCGAFVALLEQAASVYEAGRPANSAGVIGVTHRGPIDSSSSPSEIVGFLDEALPEERMT